MKFFGIAREANDPFALSMAYGMVGMHMLLNESGPHEGQRVYIERACLTKKHSTSFLADDVAFWVGDGGKISRTI